MHWKDVISFITFSSFKLSAEEEVLLCIMLLSRLDLYLSDETPKTSLPTPGINM